MKVLVRGIIFLGFLHCSLACYGKGVKVEVDDEVFSTPGDDNYWPHWTPPPGQTIGDYKKWIDEYKKKKEEQAKNNKDTDGNDANGKPKDAGNDWPDDWRDLGKPNHGDAPPPWAIIENAAGKPDLCFEPPTRGNCTTFEMRYGYNPYTKDCVTFLYSGCNGNGNNFYTKDRCIHVCVDPPKSSCSGGTQKKIHEYEDRQDKPPLSKQ